MKIIYSSDIHASWAHLSSLFQAAIKKKVDCLIIGGDLVPHYLPDADKIGSINTQCEYLRNLFIPSVTDFRQRTGIRIYLDLGNDDWIYGRRILEEYDGELFHLLHMRKHKLNDTIDIIGYMNVPPTPFYRKDWEKPDSVQEPYPKGPPISLTGYTSVRGKRERISMNPASEDTIERDLFLLAKKIDAPFLFVSHCPPYGTELDVLKNGQHIGSRSVRQFIEKWAEDGRLVGSLHGHIHESPMMSGKISTQIGNSLVVNPGQNEGRRADLRYVVSTDFLF